MIWFLLGGIPLLAFGIKAFARDPRGWSAAIFQTFLIVGALFMVIYGAQQMGWIGP